MQWVNITVEIKFYYRFLMAINYTHHENSGSQNIHGGWVEDCRPGFALGTTASQYISEVYGKILYVCFGGNSGSTLIAYISRS
jgi:hypothetical protein